MNRIFSLILYLLLFTAVSFSQSDISIDSKEKVLAGPMLTYVDSYGTQIWFLLHTDAKKIDSSCLIALIRGGHDPIFYNHHN